MGNNETRDELDELLRDPVPPIHAAASRALEKMYSEWGITPGLPTPAVAMHRMADFLAAEGWRPPSRRITDPVEAVRLPIGTVVINADGQVAQRYDGAPAWWQVLDGDPCDTATLLGGSYITVLHMPDEADQDAKPSAAEVNLVAAVAELAEVADDIRFMHRGELADRLDAIIAHHFGYIAIRIGEETSNA